MGVETGIRIKKIREYRNFTQTHMANKLDISQNAYSKIESGATQLTTDRLEQIAGLLDVPMETILNSERPVFNLDNNHIDKFYGYIENLHEENMEAMQKTIAVMQGEIDFMREQNGALLKMLGKKPE